VARTDAGRPGRSQRLAGEYLILVARAAPGPASPRLTMAIPRKLVPSSPVRNLIRRVIREAHRDAARAHAHSLGPQGLWSVRFQLVKTPVDPASTDRNDKGQPIRAFARRPTDRILKRQVRTEADSLLRRVLARLPVDPVSTPS